MWQKSTLGSSCKMYQPKTISKKEMVPDGKYVVFGANGIIGKYNQYNHAEPQLLVTCRGATCGAVNISEPFSWINGNAIVIQPDASAISLKYMGYLFRGRIDLSKAITGAAQPQITKQSLKPIEFSYPPLREQQRIVARLDAAFVEIDYMLNSSELKHAEAASISPKMVKKMLEDESYDWTSERLSSIAKNLDAQRIPIAKSKRSDGNIPYYGASGLIDYVKDFIFDEELLLISEDGANLLARTYPIAFSIEGKTWVNNHAHVLKFENKMLQRWVEYYLNSTHIAEFISGMAQPKLNQKKLNEIPILCPKLDLLPQLLSNLEQILSQSEILIELETQKIRQIEFLKAAILTQELQSEAA